MKCNDLKKTVLTFYLIIEFETLSSAIVSSSKSAKKK